MTWLLRTRSSAGSASFTKRCRDLPSFRRMDGAHTRNSFPAGPCPVFPGSSRVEKKNAVQRGRTAEGAKSAVLKPAPIQYSAMQLVRGGLGLFSRQDADEAAVTAPVLELHDAGTIAKSVSSLPCPTFSPAWCLVPRWRTRIVPALTNCPPKRLTPSLCPCESRPFVEEPPPFLLAMT